MATWNQRFELVFTVLEDYRAGEQLRLVAWFSLLGVLIDVGGALVAFPTGLSSPGGVCHLLIDALRLWVTFTIFLSLIAWVIVLIARRRRLTWNVGQTAPVILSAMFAATLAATSAAAALSWIDRDALEFPGIGRVYDFAVLVLAALFAIALFLTQRRLMRTWLLDREMLAKALLSTASASVLVAGVVSVHVAVAPVYEHRVTLLCAGMSVLSALLLGALARLHSRPHGPARRKVGVVLALLMVSLFASWPLSRSAHARFVLFGHVPVAGAVGVLVRSMTDWDGDGAGPWYMGGADCAPSDGAISPGLNDVPGDGIDQDCRGGDAPLGRTVELAALAPNCSPPGQLPVNVVLVTVDALRADLIRPEISPFLFKLRNQSQYYERAYPPSGSTTGSVLGIFSGLALSDMNSVGLTSNAPLLNLETIPELFAAEKQPVALLNFFALNQQINQAADLTAMPWADPLTQPAKRGLHASAMVRTLLDFTLHRHESSSFAWAHIPDLHAPYTLKSDIPGVSNYERAAMHVDAQLQRLYSALLAAHQLEKTLLVITSDHGEQLGERGREGHGTLFFEEGLRVPLFVVAPGCSPQWNRQPVSLRSLFELVKAYGIEGRRTSPAAAQDLDLAKRVAPPVVVEEAMLTALGVKRTFIGPRYKVIDDVANGGSMAFDLELDPDELTNIKGDLAPGLLELEAQAQIWLDSQSRR